MSQSRALTQSRSVSGWNKGAERITAERPQPPLSVAESRRAFAVSLSHLAQGGRRSCPRVLPTIPGTDTGAQHTHAHGPECRPTPCGKRRPAQTPPQPRKAPSPVFIFFFSGVYKLPLSKYVHRAGRCQRGRGGREGEIKREGKRDEME